MGALSYIGRRDSTTDVARGLKPSSDPADTPVVSDPRVPTPTECPFGVGDPFVIVVRSDVKTCHGNVSVPAGTYVAWKADDLDEPRDGVVVVWSPSHYAAPVWVTLASWLWSFPDEPERPLPEHVCSDNLRSGVAGGIFCSICLRKVAA